MNPYVQAAQAREAFIRAHRPRRRFIPGATVAVLVWATATAALSAALWPLVSP